jgi:hypothetical protein
MKYDTCIKCGKMNETVVDIQFTMPGKTKKNLRTLCPKCIEEMRTLGIIVEVI